MEEELTAANQEVITTTLTSNYINCLLMQMSKCNQMLLGIWKKCDESDFECGRWANLSISTADLQEFSHTTVSRVYLSGQKG